MASSIPSVCVSDDGSPSPSKEVGVSPSPASPPSGVPIIPGEEDEDAFELRAVPEEVAAVLRDGVIVEEEEDEEKADDSQDNVCKSDATAKQVAATKILDSTSANLLNIRTERAERKISFSVTKGRLNAERALAAAHWVDKEIRKLISAIQEHGDMSKASGKYEVAFGTLFKATENTMEALAGTLKTAKKHKVVGYESELLFQGQHDHVIITLLRDTIEDSDANTYTYRQVRSMSVSRKKLGKQFETKTLQNANSKCTACGKTVYTMEFVGAAGKAFHKACFRCKVCKSTLRADNYSTAGKDFYCKPHYEAAFRANASYDFEETGTPASTTTVAPEVTTSEEPQNKNPPTPCADPKIGAAHMMVSPASGAAESAPQAAGTLSTDESVATGPAQNSAPTRTTAAVTPVAEDVVVVARESTPYTAVLPGEISNGNEATESDGAQQTDPEERATALKQPLQTSVSSESMVAPTFSPAPPPDTTASPTTPANNATTPANNATTSANNTTTSANNATTPANNATNSASTLSDAPAAGDTERTPTDDKEVNGTPVVGIQDAQGGTSLETGGDPTTDVNAPGAAPESDATGAASESEVTNVQGNSESFPAPEVLLTNDIATTSDAAAAAQSHPTSTSNQHSPSIEQRDSTTAVGGEAPVGGGEAEEPEVAPLSSTGETGTAHNTDTSEYIDINRATTADTSTAPGQSSDVNSAADGVKESAPDVLTLIGNMVGPQSSDTSDGERSGKRVGFGDTTTGSDDDDDVASRGDGTRRVVATDNDGIVMLSDEVCEGTSVTKDNRDSIVAAFPQAINDKFISANLHKIDHTKARPDRTASTSSDIVQFAEIEAAAIAAAYGHADDEVLEAFRDHQFGHKDHSDELKRRALELKLLSSMLFKDGKALYPHVIDAPFDGAGLPLGTGERAEALSAYTRSKKHDDTEVLYITRLHKIDRATYLGKKDEIVVLTNAALYVISFVKPKTKYRVRYDQIKCVTVSSFYDGIMVLHAEGDMGDRIFDTSGTHCMEFVCNLARAAHRSQQLNGAKVPVLCRSEIVHQIKGKKVGKIIFKLFGDAGAQIVKEGNHRCLQVTAPKIAGTVTQGTSRPVSMVASQSPQSAGDASDVKAWHEME